MKYNLIFFPWVGIVIAGLTFAAWKIGLYYELPGIVLMLILGLIPILVTGGFHIDGFMDVEDARRSYGDVEKKREILKDPHIGAFSVIGLLKVCLLYGIGLGIIVYRGSDDTVILYGALFVICRCISGIGAKVLKKAKKDGMLYEETRGSGHLVEILLIIQLVMTVLVMLLVNIRTTVITASVLTLHFILYRHMAYKEFGGVTGDTAGYLLVMSETFGTLIIALCLML